MSKMRIHYISYGEVKTGGYRHEKCLYDTLCALKSESTQVNGQLIRRNRLFKSLMGYLDLILWSYFKSNADINIVTARTALSAVLRNWFTQNEVWIVLHNFDENDGKSARMVTYYSLLFKWLKKARHQRFKIITGAPYWVQYFKDEQGLDNVFLFPNFFDLKVYEPFRKNKKDRWVFMGQWSTKNDIQLIALSKRLSQLGYYCYFSTLNAREVKDFNGSYEIISFDTHENFLEQMSRATCTLALIRVNEGWNRIAHESLLVNTPVIGFKRGGLGDLLKESHSVIVNSIEEAYNCIEGGVWVLPDDNFVEKYDIKNTTIYLKEVCNNH